MNDSPYYARRKLLAPRRRAIFLLVVVAGQAWAAVRPVEAVEATVRVVGGRRFTAEVDARSDGEHLRLRFDAGTTTILRPIAWSAIAEAAYQGRTYTAQGFREAWAQGLVTTSTAPAASAPPLVRRSSPGEQPMPRRGGLRPWNVPDVGKSTTPAPSVAMLDVDASLAQWDADVETDGLIVFLNVLDRNGVGVGVDATAEIELLGPATAPLTRGNGFPVYGRWTRALRAADAPAGAYRLQLEFQAFHPDWSYPGVRHGMVHVRLHVPGRGTFESSVDAVPLRTYTPTRDYVEQAFGTRFLPNETTGRGHGEASRVAP